MAAASIATTRVTPLTKRLLAGVVIGFAAIAIVLVGVWFSLDQRHRAVDANVESIVEAEGAASAAAYAMENATTEAGLAIDEYVATGAAGLRQRVDARAVAFERAREEFEKLSRTPSQRALGAQVAALHQRQLRIGGIAMGLRDRREALRARVEADFVSLDEIRGELSTSGSAAASDARLDTLRGDLRELERHLGQFFATPNQAHQLKALENLDRVNARLAGLARRPTGSEAWRLLDRIGALAEGVALDVREVVDLDARMREADQQLVDMRGEFEALHHTIQGIAHLELAAASKQATHAIRPEASLALVGAIIIVAGLAGGTILWRSLRLRDAALELDAETRRRQAAERERERVIERLVTAQEEERQRVSRELHDQIGQKLSALTFGLDSLSGQSGPRAAWRSAQDLERLRNLAGELLDDAQSVAHQLRPPELADLGLHRALASLIETWEESYGVSADFFSEIEGTRLAPVIETTLYRVVQEALANVRKHAEARTVSVQLKRLPGSMRLVIEDDGRGFDTERPADPQRPHKPLGLQGIRERVELVGGTLEVDSSPSEGTTLLVVIPLDRGAA